MNRLSASFWLWVGVAALALFFSVFGIFLIWEMNYYDSGIFFLLMIPSWAVSLIVLVMPVITLIAWMSVRKKSGWLMGIPFAISCIAALALFFVDTTGWWLKINDWRYNEARMAFFHKVLANPPKTSSENFYDNMTHYPKGQYLSIGDTAAFFKLTDKGPLLLFMTFEGIPDGFSGFLYSSTEIDPKREWPELDLEWADLWDSSRHVYFVGNR